MKRLLILLIVLIPVFVQAQTTVYLSLQPVDLGIGLRVDHQVSEKYGLYVSGGYGNYRLPYDGYINDHLKLAFGAMRYLPPASDNGMVSHFGIGIVHDRYGDMYITIPDFPDMVLQPLSFECIVGVRLYCNFTAGIRYNFVKNESTIDFGYMF